MKTLILVPVVKRSDGYELILVDQIIHREFDTDFAKKTFPIIWGHFNDTFEGLAARGAADFIGLESYIPYVTPVTFDGHMERAVCFCLMRYHRNVTVYYAARDVMRLYYRSFDDIDIHAVTEIGEVFEWIDNHVQIPFVKSAVLSQLSLLPVILKKPFPRDDAMVSPNR